MQLANLKYTNIFEKGLPYGGPFCLFIILLLVSFQLPARAQENSKAKTLYGHALRLQYNGQFEQAVKLYDEVIGMDPEFYMASFNRGKANRELKQWNEAILDFDRVIEQDSMQIEAIRMRGDCYLKTGKFKEGLEDFDRILAIIPSHYESKKNKALALYYLRAYDDAVSIYNQLLIKDPKDTDVYFRLGMAKYHQSDFEGAIEEFSYLLRFDSEHQLALEMRGTCYQKANNIEMACKDFEEAVNKGSRSAMEMMAKYCE